MNWKNIKYFVVILLFNCSGLFAQQEKSRIEFQVSIQQEKLVLGQRYYLPQQEDSISLDVIRFYISDLQLFNNELLVKEIDKKYILLDLEKPESLSIELGDFSDEFNKVKFNLGIDSLTNVSGAMSGDLDPMHGMYWTWQSGYINFKMEGQADKCPARKNEFQFHLGGYQDENLAMQPVEVKINKMAERPVITFPIDSFLKHINLAEDYRIMSPSEEAVKKSKLIAKLFEIDE